MPALKLDHCVIHVSDWQRSNAFYRDVMGAQVVARGKGWVYRFGDMQLNCHGPGLTPSPVARVPVQPGNSDLCFEWPGPIDEAKAHLEDARRRHRARAGRACGRARHGRQPLLPRSRRLAAGVHLVQPVARAWDP